MFILPKQAGELVDGYGGRAKALVSLRTAGYYRSPMWYNGIEVGIDLGNRTLDAWIDGG